MATSSPGAPPDTPAKIAADIESAARGLQHIAARVEALGLQPSERDTTARVVRQMKTMHATHQRAWAEDLEDWIAALAPIAEVKP